MPDPTMADRFPGYDVLSKRPGLSWNDKTREVIARRLSISSEPRFFNRRRICDRCRSGRPNCAAAAKTRSLIPVAALVDQKLHLGQLDGYRHKGTPRERRCVAARTTRPWIPKQRQLLANASINSKRESRRRCSNGCRRAN